MARIENIRDFKVTSGDRFFFDNNIWMLIFSASVSGSRLREQRAYSNFFGKIQTVRATIFINALVASEYVNANLKLGFNAWKKLPENIGKNNYKRDFRPTEAFRVCQKVTYAELDQILKISDRKPDDFNAIEPSKILNATTIKMDDFNDAYLVAYCNLNNLILVTDDKDMFETPLNVRILTNHRV